LYDLYRGATQQEMEDAMGDWLRVTIARLEAEEVAKTAATSQGAEQKTTAPVAH